MKGEKGARKIPSKAYIPVVIATVARLEVSGGLWKILQAAGAKQRFKKEEAGKSPGQGTCSVDHWPADT